MKIAVMVLSNDEVCVCARCSRDKRSGNYADMVQAVRDTWASKEVPGVKVFYIYGHRTGITFPEESETIVTTEQYWPHGSAGEGFSPEIVKSKKAPFAIGDCIYSDTPEGRANLYYKTIDGYQWLLENEEFDYVLRTNCGSYIDLEIMANEVSKEGKRDNVYRGFIGHYDNRHNLPGQVPYLRFASGAAFLTSRNLVEDLVSKREQIQHVTSPYASKTIGDDTTFANHFINFCGAELTPFPRADFEEIEQVNESVKNVMHCYFRHTINPDIMYAVHKFKGHVVATHGEEA